MELIKKYYWIPLLFIFLIVGFYLVYYPHLTYKYPFHVDEWQHFAMAEEAILTGKVPSYFPAYKDHPDAGTLKWERNFHSLLSVFFSIMPFEHEITMTIIPTILSLVMMISSFLLIYYLTNSKISALFGALILATIKTNVTTLGPWFAVPVSAGLTFLPLILYLFLKTFHSDNPKIFFVTAIVFTSSVLMNPYLVVLVPVFLIYLLSKPRLIIEKKREIILAILALLVIFIIFIPSFLTNPLEAVQTFVHFSLWGKELAEVKFNIINYIGYLPFIFSIIGVFFSVKNPKDKSFLLTSLFGTLLVIVFIYTNYDVSLMIAYRRAFLYLVQSAMLMSIVGIFSIYKMISKYNRYSFLVLIFLLSFLIYEPITSFDLYSGLLKNYISDVDYENILWMRNNLPQESVILATPETSLAITPIAHKYIANYAFSPIEDLSNLLQYPCSYGSIKDNYFITHIYQPGTLCSDISQVYNEIYVYS